MNATKQRRLRYLAGAALVVLVALISLKSMVVPNAIKYGLVSALSHRCNTCELKLGRAHLFLFPPAFSVANIQFTWGSRRATHFHFEAERIFVPFSLRPLFSGRLRLGRLQIERPKTTVIEGDLVTSPGTAGLRVLAPIDVEIMGVDLKEGSFDYVREHMKERGKIRVSRISISTGPLGSSNRESHKMADARGTGILENSGNIALGVTADIFAAAPHVNLTLEVTGQNLTDLNGFFSPIDGVQLRGRLMYGRSSVSIRGTHLVATSYAHYQNLDVAIHKNEERSALSAFLQGLVASLKMGKQNVTTEKTERQGSVTLERDPNDTLISFILIGMKESAFKVASQAGR